MSILETKDDVEPVWNTWASQVDPPLYVVARVAAQLSEYHGILSDSVALLTDKVKMELV